jgi:hypothetical protein
MKLIQLLNEVIFPPGLKKELSKLKDEGWTVLGGGDNGIALQKGSTVKKLTTDVDELEHAEKLLNHSFSCIIPITNVEILPDKRTGIIDMVDAEELAEEERQEISINGTKAEDYLVYDEELSSDLSDKLKEFLTRLKEAFKKSGINPDEIDWSPTNVMNYKGSYVLVDV